MVHWLFWTLTKPSPLFNFPRISTTAQNMVLNCSVFNPRTLLFCGTSIPEFFGSGINKNNNLLAKKLIFHSYLPRKNRTFEQNFSHDWYRIAQHPTIDWQSQQMCDKYIIYETSFSSRIAIKHTDKLCEIILEAAIKGEKTKDRTHKRLPEEGASRRGVTPDGDSWLSYAIDVPGLLSA